MNGIIIDLRPKLEHEIAANKRVTCALKGVERNLAEKETLLTSHVQEKRELQSKLESVESQVIFYILLKISFRELSHISSSKTI